MNKNNMLTRFDEGKSHEENPNGGVMIGNNNSVEQGESKSGNFVYSNRIFLDSNIISQYNLPKSLLGKSVAAATKMIDDKFKGRNDKISKSTKDSMLSKIAEAQESMKPQEPEMVPQEDIQQSPEMIGNPSQMAWGGFTDSVIGQGFGEEATGAQQSSAIGAGLGTLTGVMDLGRTAFGKSSQDTNGLAPSTEVNTGAMIGNSALKGATAGMAFGPLGAGIGAVVGGVAGLVGSGKAKKDAIKNTNNYARNINRQFSDQYALGGEIDPPTTIPLRSTELENSMERYKLLRASAVRGSNVKSEYKPDLRTPEQAMMDYQYLRDSAKPGFNVNSGYTPNLTSPEEAQRLYNKARGRSFALGGNLNKMDDGGYIKPKWINEGVYNMGNVYNGEGTLNDQNLTNDLVNQFSTSKGVAPGQYVPQTTLKSSFGEQAWESTKAVGKYVNDNAGNIARYAPIAANAYQLSQLKKPQDERLDRLSNRYKPSYVDMAQQQNIVNQELNNTNSAIQQSGASQGAARNAILGAQLNKTKALSNAYMNAQMQNAAQDDRAQQFNLGVDQTNLQQSNSELDINDRNSAAYRNEKSKYISAIGNDIGDVGKEQVQKKMISTATGYTYDGEYVKSPNGNIVTDPDTGKPMTGEKMKTLQSTKNVKKQALGGYLIKNKIK